MDARPGRSRTALRMVATLSLVYLISQFLRSSHAVIAPELMRELALSSADLAALSSVFFAVFAGAQLAIGVLLDRFGPRRTVAGTLVFAVAGCLVFAAADSVALLIAGRALMGLGCAAVMVGALVVFARWFSPVRYATLGAVVLGTGDAANMLATTPFAVLADAIGWRAGFVAAAAVTALMIALTLVFIRDAPPGHVFHGRRRETLRETLRGVGEVIRQPLVLPIMLMCFASHGATSAVFGLWGAPYLNDVYGLGTVARGDALMVMAVAMLVGTLVHGPLDQRLDRRKPIAVASAAVMTAALAALAVLAAPPLWLAVLMFALIGAANGVRVVLFAHGRAMFPERLVGRGMTLINMSFMGGVAVLQAATGAVLGAFGGDGAAPEAGYRAVFAVLAAAVGLALAGYLRSRDVRPSVEAERQRAELAEPADRAVP